MHGGFFEWSGASSPLDRVIARPKAEDQPGGHLHMDDLGAAIGQAHDMPGGEHALRPYRAIARRRQHGTPQGRAAVPPCRSFPVPYQPRPESRAHLGRRCDCGRVKLEHADGRLRRLYDR